MSQSMVSPEGFHVEAHTPTQIVNYRALGYTDYEVPTQRWFRPSWDDDAPTNTEANTHSEVIAVADAEVTKAVDLKRPSK